MTLLGDPVLARRAVDPALKDKVVTLEKSLKRLSHLTSHVSLCLLKNSIAMPNLLYTLRTSPCAGNPLLQEFDNMLRTGLETILNVQMSDLQWMQASLPVHMRGLGVQQHLARSLPKSQQTPLKSTVGIVCFHLLQIYSPSRREEEATEIWLTWSSSD